MTEFGRTCWMLALTLAVAGTAPAADLVKAGKPVATIVVDPSPAPVKGKRPVAAHDDAFAAKLVGDWVKKITDAELPISDKPPTDGNAIYVGRAAARAGLKLDDIDSPSKEGVRIAIDGNRILIGGQSNESTVKAAARFLEELGCRCFMDGPLGEVFPRSKDLSVAPKTITEKPALVYRNPKGPSWPGTLWKAWNGAGGESFSHSHSWGNYIPKDAFEKHPEYFAQGTDGQRKDGSWLCTSNPGARQMFADQVIVAVKAGNKHPSISPPDGRGYCQCDKCKAQDDPKVIEPSSGNVAVSNRYADFFDDIGKRVAKETPEALLSFYCYADYTQAPTFDRKLSPNLVAVIAPIRYCRMHPIGDPDCPSRKQMLGMIDGWASRASHLGYYNYMYNLADVTLPFFKYTPCKSEFPYLVDKGLMYMTIEVVSNWYVYGPQIYLSLRMAYDPKLDAAAVMEDYYTKFYGPAAPHMKAYWLKIDEAVAHHPCHSGGWFGLNLAYTPEVMRVLESALAKASDAAKGDEMYSARVAMHAAGFQNVIDYKAINAAMARGDFQKAKQVYDGMVSRIGGLIKLQAANPEYGTAYLSRFLSKSIYGGIAATAAPNKVVQVLPDRWRYSPDDDDTGEMRRFAASDFDDSKWKEAATHSSTLSRQGLRENTVIWYRTTFKAPEKSGPLSLLFPEVDGTTTVYLNGKALTPVSALPPPAAKPKGKDKPASGPPKLPRRAPFVVDLSPALKPGADNVVVVKADNRSISELFLGGILRPVVLIEKPK